MKPPQAYYNRLRQAYFGTRNESDMEDELNFKTLFLRNLHPGISHHLGVLTESGMHPRPTENETHTLARPKQRYDRWDGTRGHQRSPGRHWDKSWDQARPHESQ